MGRPSVAEPQTSAVIADECYQLCLSRPQSIGTPHMRMDVTSLQAQTIHETVCAYASAGRAADCRTPVGNCH